MKITIFGTGYAGLVTGTCLAQVGHDVMCIDIDEKKIADLQKGVVPIYEPGLEELIIKNVKAGRLLFSTDSKAGVRHGEAIFNVVGTPPDKENQDMADLKFIKMVAKTIGEYINEYKVVINKSTVPVGTGKMCHEIIKREIYARSKSIEFDIASNPEFLREGSAVSDFLNPDRVVLGSDTSKAKRVLHEIYKPFERNNAELFFTDVQSAELIKYAANSFLATKISFINEIANFAEIVGADINDVSKGIGLDPRIGNKFLSAGAGYGGSCFPKDVKALIESGKKEDYDFQIIRAADNVNSSQKHLVGKKIIQALGSVAEKNIAIWGLAFKPDTDDVREAVSEVIISDLEKSGVQKIRAYDPVAINAFKQNNQKITTVDFTENPYDTLSGTDVLVLVTEWDEFYSPDWKKIKREMNGNTIIDARNIWDREVVESYGFKYIAIGR